MKADEAPKKLYFGLQGDTGILDIYSKRESDNDIEYIRKDAFIEKACDAYCAICDTKECDGCAKCTWVIKFRRQLMKLL